MGYPGSECFIVEENVSQTSHDSNGTNTVGVPLASILTVVGML